MDGDLAPLPRLAELARRYEAMLLVDETHAVGVFGTTGRGVIEHFSAEHPELERRVSLRVGTFGKALGVAGGFVCGRRALVQWLANRARTYVFSTAQPAALSAAALAALEIVAANPGQGGELLARAARLRERLRQLGWNTGESTSQIIPLVIGSAEETMRVSAALRERGYWAPGIRPPSVPPERSLLRLGLTLGHTEEMTEGLLTALQNVGATPR
jgi:7-keto-8-aminopelargonate synthetase-like enzyme